MLLTRHITGKIFGMLLLLGLLVGMVAVPRIGLCAAGAASNGVSGALNSDSRHSSYAVDSPYGKAEYLYDTLTITGSGMKQGEKIYAVKNIEKLYQDEQFGCDVTYSITGSEGKYKSYTLSGVRLYELLVQAGIDTSLPDSTAVTIMAKDGYNSIHTLGEIRNIDQYNYYNEAGQSQAGNLPVIVVFASNGYPLVGPIGLQGWFDSSIAGLNEENANGGGPLKITFGQTEPGSNNAQYNSKLLTKIIIGNDVKSAQHNRSPYSQYEGKELLIKLINSSTSELMGSKTYTVKEIEAMINAKKTAAVRNYYPDTEANYYEGIDLWYLLADQFGLTGNEGEFSIVDASGNESSHINLDYLLNPGKDYSAYYTTKDGLQISWVKPVLAYAQNGKPLQDEGPLLAALPQHKSYLAKGLMKACTGINIYIVQDKCTHTTEPYSKWENDKITFTGDGLNKSQNMTVANLEQLLELIQDDSYIVGTETATYRGINLYRLLQSDKLGLKMATDRIEVSSQDGNMVSFTLDELQNSNLKVMLAYGKNSKPLVPSQQDAGYDKSAANSGGPLYLVVNGDKERCLYQVTQVKVTAKATESWKHDREAPYDSFLDTTFLRICGSVMEQPEVYSLRQLEAMNDGIVREYLAASEVMGYYEGLNLKCLLQTAGIGSKPTKITVCSPDATGAVFAKELAVDDVWSGISSTTQNGAIKPVVLAYAKDGYPLTNSFKTEAGYVTAADNGYGPLRLVVENSKPLCVKYVAGIIVGDGTPVAYTVHYLDEDSGEAIAAAKVSVGMDGETIAAANEKINVTGYLFSKAEKDNIDLSASTKDCNIINLYYAKKDEQTAIVDVGMVISGSGIPQPMYLTVDKLNSIAAGEDATIKSEFRIYSVMARGGIKTMISTQGMDLGALLQQAGVGTDSYVVSTISSDTNRVDLKYNGTSKSFEPQRNFYADMLPGDNGVSGPVDPILALYRAESNEDDSNPHLPTKGELTEVEQFPLPTLTVGQTNKEDYNNQSNNKYVQQIIIGNKSATVFGISGDGLKKKLSYTKPDLMLKGIENTSISGKECQGISLARLLNGIANLDDTLAANLVTASSGGVTIYYTGGQIEHVTELIIGSGEDNSLSLSTLKNPDNKYFLAYELTDTIQDTDLVSSSSESSTTNDSLQTRPVYTSVVKWEDQKPADLLALPGKHLVDMKSYLEKTVDSEKKELFVLKPAAIEAVKKDEKESVLLFTARGDGSAFNLEVSSDFLAQVQDQEMYLQISTAQGDCIIPVAAIDISDISQKLGSDDYKLQININEVTQKQIETMQCPDSYTLQGVPISMDMFAVSVQQKIKITEFNNYVYRDLRLNQNVIPAKCTVLCWDDNNHAPRIVPVIFIERNGKIIARSYSNSNSIYAVAATSETKTFADIQKHWAQKNVEVLASKLILSGRSKDTFAPGSSVNRAEFAAMLVKALGLIAQPNQAVNFNDIKGTEWFVGSVAAAVKGKIINGMPDGSFEPQQSISRQEAAVMIAKAMQLAGVNKELNAAESQTVLARFNDQQDIAAWAYPQVAVVVQAGIMNGSSDGRFIPGKETSRAEAAMMVSALLKAAGLLDERSTVAKEIPTANNGSKEDKAGILLVEGSALVQEQAYSLADLKAMTDIIVKDSYYSRGKAKEGWAAEQHDKFTGISLYTLLVKKIGLTSIPTEVQVIADDGFTKVFTMDEVASWYIDETKNGKKLEMIIAWEQNGEAFKNQSQPYRLVFGQKYEGDFNRQNWVNYVKKVIVNQ